MTQASGPSPLLGLVAALAVLIAGIAAAVTRDDTTSTRTSPGIVSSTRPVLPVSTSTSIAPGTRTTFTTIPPSVLSTTTTIRPAVPTPEAAANGLWAAYTAGNRAAADRFAGQPVADALFGTPFSGDDGTFQGCTRRQSQTIFDCRYEQPSAQYVMTAQADAANSFKIVEITITSSG
ncbi:MAG: hypothetical protein QOD38_496 [Acidimicrobiaceae bacterium]|jgi:hypothetical protein